MPTPVMLNWSGGKDSLLALAALQADPAWQVVGLLTTISAEYQRIVMHGVREALLDTQAEALDLPLTKVYLPAAPDNSQYETAMREATDTLKAKGIMHMAFGDLFLEDVRAYREKQLAEAGMKGVYPIWGQDTTDTAQQFVDAGHRAVVVCVDGEQLSGDFCGCEYDAAFVADLPDSVDPCGENGEFHSFAYDGPLFKQPVAFTRGEKVLRNERFYYQELLP
ncbi:MAG TPA: ATP-binding protein [Gammaproteobacteria bacterium]|nr:ATP-binding protein [Gammaproteobacteria bacterium]